MRNSLTPRRFLLPTLATLCCLSAALVSTRTSAEKPVPNVGVRAAGRGRPFLNLRDGRALATAYSGDQSLAAALAGNAARPLALASADFDIDGAPDLVGGYGVTGGGGIVTLRRGNIEAFAPTGPEVFRAIQEGNLPDSFLPSTGLFPVPEAPDFLLAGDFNRDGFKDVLAGARGGSLYWLAGDGAGGFAAPQRVELPAALTALAAGEFNRGDGRTDIAVGVSGAQGDSVLVFTQGPQAGAQSFPLASPANALAFGDLDEDIYSDLAVAAGSEIEIIHGGQVKAKSGGKGGAIKSKGETAAKSDPAAQPVTAAPDASARVERIELPATARALTLGVFVANRGNRETLAALTSDGTIHLLAPSDLDTRPYTPEEIEANKLAVDRDDAQRPASMIPVWRPSAANAWRLAGQLGAAAPAGDAASGQSPLVASFLTYGESADLIVVNAGARQVNIVRALGARLRDEKAGPAPALAALPGSAALDVAGEPVALVEMPRKVNGERDLVVFSANSTAPNVVPASTLATINVDRTDDVAAASACTAALNDCSLRGAVSFANANAGTTINVPAGTYSLTIAGSCEDANATGDLDLAQSASGASIVGAGAATTIIKQTTNDGVFHTNPPATNSPTYSFSGLTIRDALKDSSCAVPRAGGGIVFAGSINNGSVTSCIFDNNHLTASVNANGGAITQSAGASGDAGDLTVTNCTFINNKTDTGVGGAYRLSGGTGTASLNMTGCTFDNNETTTNEGGGMFLTSTTNGSFTISKSTFTNNKALDPNDGTGGGGIQKSNGVTTVSFCRFRNNQVFHGIVSGNQVDGSGEGVKLGGNDNFTASNNWWGCNTDPYEEDTTPTPIVAAAGCDSAFKVHTVTGNLITLPQLFLHHTASPAPIVTGQTTTLTASVNTNSANSDVSANVDVLLGLPLAFSNPVRGGLSGAGSIIQTAGAGKGTATATFRASAAGAGSADATVESAVATASFTINKADTTTTITSDTPDPTVSGQSFTVNFSLSVNAPGSNNPTVPTGNVTVTADTGEQCTGSINASTPATGSCSITVFHAGNRTLTAVYGGDANFNVSPASSPATAHTVNKADTTTSITSDNPDPSVTNQSVTVAYSVSVTSPGSAQAGNPTGNVVVTDNGNTFCTGTVAGTGSCSAPLTSVGPHSFVATYQGDANYNASPASSPATAHTVNKADTTASILTDTPDPTTPGQSFTVTYSVAVTSPGSNSPTAPTGNVQVTDGVDSCTGTVAAGQCTIALNTVGNRTLTATYQGDSNFNASPASTGAPHTVSKINTTTTVVSSKNPSDVGDNVTFTATITPAQGSAQPTGTVQFRDGPTGTGTPIGAPVNVTPGAGNTATASVQAAALTAGTHTITADYNGDTIMNTSTGAVPGGQLVIAGTPTSAGDVLISEFRFRGAATPSGAQDEFIELYNNTGSQLVVPAAGWQLRSVSVGGTTAAVFNVPAGTTIPSHAHYLVTNQTPAVGFSLGNYPMGVGTNVGTGDGQYTGIDIPDGGGVALFNSSSLFDATTRLDSVGFTSAPDTLYRAGAGLSPAGGITADGQYSFVRILTSGVPQNTNDNAADFVFVAVDAGTYSGVVSVRGGPGPEALGSPLQRNAQIKASLIDPAATSSAQPNRVRDNTSGGAGTPTAFGTLEVRRKFTNTTGSPVTRLRFRIVDITATNSPGQPLADVRMLSSANTTVTTSGGSVTVLGTTLETPPTQAQGGGLNSSVVVTVPGGVLAPSASVNIRFVLGVAVAGNFRFFVNVEALP